MMGKTTLHIFVQAILVQLSLQTSILGPLPPCSGSGSINSLGGYETSSVSVSGPAGLGISAYGPISSGNFESISYPGVAASLPLGSTYETTSTVGFGGNGLSGGVGLVGPLAGNALGGLGYNGLLVNNIPSGSAYETTSTVGFGGNGLSGGVGIVGPYAGNALGGLGYSGLGSTYETTSSVARPLAGNALGGLGYNGLLGNIGIVETAYPSVAIPAGGLSASYETSSIGISGPNSGFLGGIGPVGTSYETTSTVSRPYGNGYIGGIGAALPPCSGSVDLGSVYETAALNGGAGFVGTLAGNALGGLGYNGLLVNNIPLGSAYETTSTVGFGGNGLSGNVGIVGPLAGNALGGLGYNGLLVNNLPSGSAYETTSTVGFGGNGLSGNVGIVGNALGGLGYGGSLGGAEYYSSVGFPTGGLGSAYETTSTIGIGGPGLSGGIVGPLVGNALGGLGYGGLLGGIETTYSGVGIPTGGLGSSYETSSLSVSSPYAVGVGGSLGGNVLGGLGVAAAGGLPLPPCTTV